MAHTAGPKLSKNRKLGKSKKKAWRASNVQDIEDFLNEERRQIEAGGLVSEKADESLFVLDTSLSSKEKDTEPLSKKQRREKPLKSLALLLPDPHSNTVRKPDTDNFQKGKRAQVALKHSQDKLNSKSRIDAQKQRAKSIAERDERRKSKEHLQEVTTDIWADGHPEEKRITRKRKKDPSALPATVLPHPGASANPSYEDHQDLLKMAIDKEIMKKKEERKIYNALDAKFPSMKNAPDVSTYFEEMSAGLFDDSEEEEEEEEGSSSDTRMNPIVRRESKKTKRQRRIEAHLKNENEEKRIGADVRMRENMVYRIPTIKTEIKRQDAKQRERACKRQNEKEKMPFNTKRLGRIKYSDPALDVKLSSELVGSLRQLKPEGHVLNDIYKSMQRRNVIEPRLQQKNKRKYKRKVYTKKSHKSI